MSNFTINANHFLRNDYSMDRALIDKTERAITSCGKLAQADSSAIRRAVKKLGSYDYTIDEKKVTTEYKTNFSKDLRAFIDSYNYAVESSKSSTNEGVTRAGKKLQNVSKKYEETLKDLGITIKSGGYMEIKDSATSSLKLSTFGRAFSKDSDYMKEIEKAAKSIQNHVDFRA